MKNINDLTTEQLRRELFKPLNVAEAKQVAEARQTRRGLLFFTKSASEKNNNENEGSAYEKN